MNAKPFHPSMNKPRRQIPGWVHAATFFLVITGSAWAGQHGWGRWIGTALWWLFACLFWMTAVVMVAGALAGMFVAVAWLCRRILIDPQEDLSVEPGEAVELP